MHAVTLLISALALCSCARTVSVGLDNARTSIGYVNSGLLPEGSIFVVERKGAALRAQQLTQQPLDTFEKQTPVQGDSLTATHLSDFGISFSGNVSKALQTALETKIASETTLNLTNFVTDRLRDPLYVLNSPALAVWRQNTGDEYGMTEANHQRFRFLFISGATQSDECMVSLGAPRNSPSAKFSVVVSGQRFQVEYSGRPAGEIRTESPAVEHGVRRQERGAVLPARDVRREERHLPHLRQP